MDIYVWTNALTNKRYIGFAVYSFNMLKNYISYLETETKDSIIYKVLLKYSYLCETIYDWNM